MTNGEPQGARLQFATSTPQPGVMLVAFLHGQCCAQAQMTLADADKFCAAWREAIDRAKSPIEIVGPGSLVKP